jgi:hypothetical protein
MLVLVRLATHAVRASQRSDPAHEGADPHRDRLGVMFDVPKRSTHLTATHHCALGGSFAARVTASSQREGRGLAADEDGVLPGLTSHFRV